MKKMQNKMQMYRDASACTASGYGLTMICADISGISAFFVSLSLRVIIYLRRLIASVFVHRRAYPAF